FRYEFLTGSALSRNEHRAVGSAHDFDHLEELLHLLALPDEIAHSVDFLEFAAQVRVFFTQPAILERAVDNQLQLFHEVFGLQDVIEGSHLQSLYRRLGTGKRGKQDELAAERGFAKFTQKIDSRHIRHLDVRNDEIEFRCLQLRESF